MTEEKKRGRPRKDTAEGEAPDTEKTTAQEFAEAVVNSDPQEVSKSLEKFKDKINKASEGETLKFGINERTEHLRIPTGIIDLDLKLSGGWPIGGLNVMYGPPSSGKSLIALKTIASTQHFCKLCNTPFSEAFPCDCEKKKGRTVLYVDAEHSWTNEWSSRFGINLADVMIGHPENMEEAFDIIDSFINKKMVDLIILDSVAGLIPKAEQEGTMEEWQTGLVPRLYTKFLRKWAGELSRLTKQGKQPSATLFINQIRKKVGVPAYMNPDIMPGGEAQYFFGTDIIKVTKKGIEMSPDKKDPRPLYQTIRFVVEKSKASAVKLEGRFDVTIHDYKDADETLHKVGTISNDKTLIEYAEKFSVLKDAPLEFRGKTYTKISEIKEDLLPSGNIGLRWKLFQLVSTAYVDYVPYASKGKVGDED